MRTWSAWLGIPAALAILLAIANVSCKPKSPKEAGTEKPSAAQPPGAAGDASKFDPDKVAVTVDGVNITEGDLHELIKPQLDVIAAQAKQLPPSMLDQYKKQLREQGLEQLIRSTLLDQKVKGANIVVTNDEVVTKIREIVSNSPTLLSIEEVKKQIEQYGRDFEKVKQDVRTGLLRNRFMEMQWKGKTDVTEDEAKKYYDQNPKRFEMPEQIRASHILIKFDTPESSTDPNAAKAKAKAKIEGLLKQIREGADFAELAKANSVCPSAPDGGDLGFFPRGKTTPAFGKVAFELKVGQVSDIVETEYGYHIIKVTDHKDAGVVSFEQAKADIISQLTEEKQAKFVEDYINSLKANANIVFPVGT